VTSKPLVVRDSELDYDSDLVFTLDGKAFTGVAYEESAELGRSEICYRDGLQEGVARDWYPSGMPKGESCYVRNVLHGTSREFDEQGRLMVEDRYEYGICVLARRFSVDGTVTETNELDANIEAARQLNRLRAEHDWDLDT
jgi:antitoxin component YwqK of YwqJK toxin-antitoxin module